MITTRPFDRIRLTEGFTLAGFETDDDGTIPVVGWTPPDLETRADVIRWQIGQLRRRRADLTDDQFRELLRSQGEPGLAPYCELSEWHTPSPKRALTLAEAKSLIESADAVPVYVDLDDLERIVASWEEAV